MITILPQLSFFIGLMAAKGDQTQRIFSPDIVNIPFIDWVIMVSQGSMIKINKFKNSIKLRKFLYLDPITKSLQI